MSTPPSPRPRPELVEPTPIPLPHGGHIVDANFDALASVLQAHGALTAIAESPVPVHPAQIDPVIDMLAKALHRLGAIPASD